MMTHEEIDITEKLFDSSQKAMKSMSMHQVGKDEMESHGEDRARQLSNVIRSCNTSITKATNDLVEEVCTLEAQLSAITKERNDLVETVKSLNAKLSHIQHRENHVDVHLDTENLDCPEVVTPDSEEDDILVESCEMSNESGGQVKKAHILDGEIR